MWNELLTAVALVLVIEGLMPFANPKGWRKTLQWIGQMSDRSIRLIGLTSMICGAVFLYLLRHL